MASIHIVGFDHMMALWFPDMMYFCLNERIPLKLHFQMIELMY